MNSSGGGKNRSKLSSTQAQTSSFRVISFMAEVSSMMKVKGPGTRGGYMVTRPRGEEITLSLSVSVNVANCHGCFRAFMLFGRSNVFSREGLHGSIYFSESESITLMNPHRILTLKWSSSGSPKNAEKVTKFTNACFLVDLDVLLDDHPFRNLVKLVSRKSCVSMFCKSHFSHYLVFNVL